MKTQKFFPKLNVLVKNFQKIPQNFTQFPKNNPKCSQKSIQIFHILALLSYYYKCAREISYKNQIHAIVGHCNHCYGIKDLKFVKIVKNWATFWDIMLEIG